MKTRQPLQALIPDILKEWAKDRPDRLVDWYLYELLNNKLLNHVKASLQEEIISQRSFNQTVRRIPAINIHKRVVDKTSKVYIDSAMRNADKKADVEVMRAIADEMDLDGQMLLSNRYLNSSFRFALEPFVNNEGEYKVRVLSAYQFMPYSDSLIHPEKMTVYVKYLSTEFDPNIGDNGEEIDILSIVSDDEFYVIDSHGRIREDLMEQMGFTSSVNPYGMIPAIVGKTDENLLMPFRNREGYEMAVLIPKLFADINFASKYLSHSVIWMKNVNADKIDINADAVWDLGSTNEDGSLDPEVGTIKPEVDIPNQLQSIASQIQNYFESIGIKTNVDMRGSNPVSAVSKAIDEADISDIRKVQIKKYQKVEKQFWALVKVMHDKAIEGNKPANVKKKFSKDFIKSFSVSFPETKAMQSVSQRLDEAEKWIDLGLKSRKQVMRDLQPELTDQQIEKQLDEAIKEKEEDFNRRMEGLPGLTSDKNNDGTFKEGNQEATKVQPENNVRGNPDGGSSS